MSSVPSIDSSAILSSEMSHMLYDLPPLGFDNQLLDLGDFDDFSMPSFSSAPTIRSPMSSLFNDEQKDHNDTTHTISPEHDISLLDYTEGRLPLLSAEPIPYALGRTQSPLGWSSEPAPSTWTLHMNDVYNPSSLRSKSVACDLQSDIDSPAFDIDQYFGLEDDMSSPGSDSADGGLGDQIYSSLHIRSPGTPDLAASSSPLPSDPRESDAGTQHGKKTQRPSLTGSHSPLVPGNEESPVGSPSGSTNKRKRLGQISPLPAKRITISSPLVRPDAELSASDNDELDESDSGDVTWKPTLRPKSSTSSLNKRVRKQVNQEAVVTPAKSSQPLHKFFCSGCGKGFTRDSDRRRHEKTATEHGGQASHPCQLCPNAFGRIDQLNRHIKLCHTNKTP